MIFSSVTLGLTVMYNQLLFVHHQSETETVYYTILHGIAE